jgi:hypothetical protein
MELSAAVLCQRSSDEKIREQNETVFRVLHSLDVCLEMSSICSPIAKRFIQLSLLLSTYNLKNNHYSTIYLFPDVLNFLGNHFYK